MLEVLQFVFSSFWVFIGTVILAVIAVQGLAVLVLGLAKICRGGR